MFCKIGVLTNFAEFTWKQLRSLTLVEKNLVLVLSCEFCKFLRILFDRTPPDNCFWIFFNLLNCFLSPSELTERKFFLFLNMFYHGFQTWWISQTLLPETGNLVVAAGKQTFLWDTQELSGVSKLINLLTFISTCLLNFCTPLYCNSLFEL